MSDDAIRLTIDEISVNAENERVATLVCDSGEIIVVPVALLPPGARRGDTLTASFALDPDETDRRRRRVRDLQRRLFGRRGGDSL